MSKNKPSLFKEDYYTQEEYTTLLKSLSVSKHIIELLLRTAIKRYLLKGIKPKLHSLLNVNARYTDGTSYNGLEIYDLIYNTHLDDIALSLNKSKVHDSICQWRFQINK